MIKRFATIAAAVAALFALLAPTPAQAEVADGWDYRTLGINGTFFPLVGQFAGDDATDILWYAPGTAPDSLWIGKEGVRGANAFTKVPLTINKSYVPIVGDFYGDDYDDIIWYAPGTAPDAAWVSTDGPTPFTNRAITINGTFRPTVLRDYRDLNLKDDILWYAPGSAKDYLWHMNESGSGAYTTVNLAISGTFQTIVGDWNADGLEDLVLYAPGTARDYRWASRTDGTFATSSLTINGRFEPATIRQQNGDGILWWADGTAPEAYWVRSGSTFASRPVPAAPVQGTPVAAGIGGAIIVVPGDLDGFFFGEPTGGDFYQLAGSTHDKEPNQRPLVGDFDDDGLIDVVWYGAGTVRDALWYSDAASLSSRSLDGGAGQERSTPVAPR